MKKYRITSLILGLAVAATMNAGAQDMTSDIRNTGAVATVSGE